MSKQMSPNLSWHEGANYPSPVQKVLAFGYYDGPTEGVLQCGNGQAYRFDLLAWEPETQDLRIFCLSPLPSPGWKQLTTLGATQESPRWPIWVVGWHEGLNQPIQDILRQAGPVEWVLATEDLRGEILRVKAVGPEELARITNWSEFLGMAQELRDAASYQLSQMLLRGNNMNENDWTELVNHTIFLSPETVEEFCSRYGDAIVFPLTFRGDKKQFRAPHSSGWPVPDNGSWYSLWNMRPSRDACSLALGLRRRDLERNRIREVHCTNGRCMTMAWIVHHVYECGDASCDISERARRFANLANLVLMDEDYHETKHGFVHEPGRGADWLKYIISKLYPKASSILGKAERPIGSPDVDMVNVAVKSDEALRHLSLLRQNEPAGNRVATRRLIEVRQGGISPIQQAPKYAISRPVTIKKPGIPLPSGRMKPNEVVKELKRLGYLARQNEKSESLFLNLGGSVSQLNRDDFQGAILLSPSRQQVFGACPDEVLDFRQLVMENMGGDKWNRRSGVTGPAEQNRVKVRFVDGDDGEPRIVCDTETGPIWIDGYGEQLCCYNDGYDWTDIQGFLTRLKNFCSQCNDV